MYSMTTEASSYLSYFCWKERVFNQIPSNDGRSDVQLQEVRVRIWCLSGKLRECFSIVLNHWERERDWTNEERPAADRHAHILSLTQKIYNYVFKLMEISLFRNDLKNAKSYKTNYMKLPKSQRIWFTIRIWHHQLKKKSHLFLCLRCDGWMRWDDSMMMMMIIWWCCALCCGNEIGVYMVLSWVQFHSNIYRCGVRYGNIIW